MKWLAVLGLWCLVIALNLWWWFDLYPHLIGAPGVRW